jgi:hypothetical protein
MAFFLRLAFRVHMFSVFGGRAAVVSSPAAAKPKYEDETMGAASAAGRTSTDTDTSGSYDHSAGWLLYLTDTLSQMNDK